MNSANHIQRAIESVLAQGDERLEYIVVDGQSSDGTVAIVESYRPVLGDRLVVVSERDSGLYDAMNKGIARATGDVIGILNSDDTYLPGALGAIRRAFQSQDAHIVFGDILVDNRGDSRVLRTSVSGILQRMTVGHPGCFVRRSVYGTWGAFDTQFRIAADYDFLLRCYLGGARFVHLDQPLARFESGGASSKSFRLALEMYKIHARQVCKLHAMTCFAKRICTASFFNVRRHVGIALVGESRYERLGDKWRG